MGSRLKKTFRFCSIVLLVLSIYLFLLSSIPEAQATESERTFTALDYDGYCYNVGDNSTYTYAEIHDAMIGMSSDSTTTLRIGQDDEYIISNWVIYRLMLYFDTSALPDGANLTNAMIRLYLQSDNSADDFNIVVQRNPSGARPQMPMDGSDYDYTYYSGNGGSFSTAGLAAGYNNITLNSSGVSWISKTGTTKFCLRNDNDISSTAPTNEETVYFYAREEGTAYAPQLVINYTTTYEEEYHYILYGAYDEDGYRDGAINCTLYRDTDSPIKFELDGNHTLDVEDALVFKFELGYNHTRTYYVYQDFEEIYVFKPPEPYYTYLFTVVDYVGVSDAYLESLLNINGTDKVVERWALDVVNELPFTFSWGTAYKLRLICNLGTYYYPEFVAGGTSEITLAITSDMFPEIPTDISDITISVTRWNYSWIQSLYYDQDNETNWIYMAIHDLLNASLIYDSTNVSGNYLNWNWYNGDSETSYYGNITVSHDQRDIVTWAIACPIRLEYENPWEGLTLLGTFPFDPDQLFGVFLSLCFVAAFSWKNFPIGIVVVVIVMMVVTYIGFLALSWTWLTISLAIAIILSIAELKERMRTI